jgi:hypothetical protein
MSTTEDHSSGASGRKVQQAPEELLAAVTEFLAPYRDGQAAAPTPEATRWSG